MPRYVIERNFERIDDAEMQAIALRSKQLGAERFPAITWEHSHVVVDAEGRIKSFCVYSAPDEQMLREHAAELGSHVVDQMYEIVGDVAPDEITI